MPTYYLLRDGKIEAVLQVPADEHYPARYATEYFAEALATGATLAIQLARPDMPVQEPFRD